MSIALAPPQRGGFRERVAGRWWRVGWILILIFSWEVFNVICCRGFTVGHRGR